MPDTSVTSATWATRVRHKRHECYTNNMNVTLVWHKQHECDTSVTRMTRGWHEWKILILLKTQVKIYFYTPILAMLHSKWMITRRGTISFFRDNFYSHSHNKMLLKSSPQNLTFVMPKATSKSYTLGCSANALARSRIVTHSCLVFDKNHFMWN